MKQVHYTDRHGRSVTKKEGFSFPTFFILLLLGVVPGIIYLVSKGGFNAIRGTVRTGITAGKAVANKVKDAKEDKEETKEDKK